MSNNKLRPPRGGRERSVHGRTAIVGGDGRRLKRLSYGPEARVFPAAKYGGNGLVRALCAPSRAGRLDRVVLLIRFVDHSTSGRIKRLCRRLGVPLDRFPGGTHPDTSTEPSKEEK